MSDFRFYSEGKDKFHNVIRLGDIIVYAGGTQSESNVTFAFVTSIRKDYSWGTTKCIIGYSPINEDLKGFRKQGNNKSKWGDSIIKVPKEWIGRFDYVRSKFNKEHFKKEMPTQDEIDAYFREKEYDEYQQIHRLGKYAPNPKKIDRREWKMLLSDAIQETATLPFSYTKKIIVECKKKEDCRVFGMMRSLRCSGRFGRVSKSIAMLNMKRISNWTSNCSEKQCGNYFKN